MILQVKNWPKKKGTTKVAPFLISNKQNQLKTILNLRVSLLLPTQFGYYAQVYQENVYPTKSAVLLVKL